MPLLKGALTYRRFRVIGPVDLNRREEYLERIQRDAFRDPLESTRTTEVTGWCSVHNLLEIGLSGSEVLHGSLMTFALRIQKKKLPAKLFKAMLQQRETRWLRETGRERVPPGVRKELREILEAELLPKVLPTVNSYDVCWDLQRKEVLLFSQSNKVGEHFRVLFSKSFGLAVRPMNAVALMCRGEEPGPILEALRPLAYSDYSEREDEGEAPAPAAAGGEDFDDE